MGACGRVVAQPQFSEENCVLYLFVNTDLTRRPASLPGPLLWRCIGFNQRFANLQIGCKPQPRIGKHSKMLSHFWSGRCNREPRAIAPCSRHSFGSPGMANLL